MCECVWGECAGVCICACVCVCTCVRVYVRVCTFMRLCRCVCFCSRFACKADTNYKIAQIPQYTISVKFYFFVYFLLFRKDIDAELLIALDVLCALLQVDARHEAVGDVGGAVACLQ